jgi:hypothetical protein
VRARRRESGFEVGDCFVYPTSDGKPRNPYVSAKREAWFYGAYPCEQDGWGAAIVLSRSHRHTVFARYVVAFLAPEARSTPKVEEMVEASIRAFDEIRFVRTPDGRYRDQGTPRPYMFAVTTSRGHLDRMRVEMVGRLSIDEPLVAAEFDPDTPRSRGTAFESSRITRTSARTWTSTARSGDTSDAKQSAITAPPRVDIERDRSRRAEMRPLCDRGPGSQPSSTLARRCR